MPIQASKDEWRKAIECARSSGAVPEAVAQAALSRLAGEGATSIGSELISVWLGLAVEPCERFLELAKTLDQVTRPPLQMTTPTLPDLEPDTEKTVLPADYKPKAPAASARRREESAAKLPTKLGRYLIREKLGEGAFGVVYLAEHEELKTPCAVKALLGDRGLSAEELKRFRREAAAVARMGKHPNIATVYDLGTDDKLGVTYFAMELIKGNSLKETLRDRHYTPREVAALVEKVARGVHHAHQSGVLHRDLKPDNVMIREADQEPLVVDFGLAREVGTEAGKSTAGAGTPSYMAPEQASRQDELIDARTDVYGLGGILYEALVGLPPHPGQDLGQVMYHILRGEVLPPRRVRPDVPRDLETICLKALDADRRKRYATAADLAEDLARFQRGEPVIARPIGRVEHLVRRVRRHPLLSTLIAASVLFALGVAWKFLGPARVVYATDPADARVEAVGATMWGRGLVWPARSFKLRVTREGCLPREVEVPATPGATIRLATVKLDSAFGTVRLETAPDGAEVLLDGMSLGTATGKAEFQVAVGNHRLRVRAERYEEEERLITVESGKAAEVGRVALAREHGTLELTGVPREMSVVVWDIAADKEVTRLSPPATLTLDTGEYELRGQLKDHFNRDARIEVRRGQTVRKDVALTRQTLWAHETGGVIWSSPALGDVNGDGVLDCVVGSNDKNLYALSGRDGAILWAYETGEEVNSSPALGDVNGDGVLDCVVGSDDNKVYALSSKDGAVLWSYETGGWVRSSPALGDMNGDGVLDCVVGSDDYNVYALSGKDGAVLWSYETGNAVESSPALGDVDGDGVLDCVVGSWNKKVYALSGRDGAVLWFYETGGWVTSSPALGDVNGDGVLDCVVGSLDTKVYALSGKDGAVLWAYETGGEVVSSPTLGDVNGNGVLDCVVGSWDKKVYALSGRDGAVLWSYETGNAVESSPALGDVNGNGWLDCVVGSGDKKVYALSGRDGAVLWSYETGGRVRSSPALGDLNGDSVLDCVVGSDDRKVYALSGMDGAVLWAYETGNVVWSSPALGDVNGDGVLDCVVGSNDKNLYALSGRDGAILWAYETGEEVNSSPALGDVNGDGVLDCVVGSDDNKVYALSGKDGAVLWAYETGGRVWSSPALGDVNGDGCLDCVVGSNDNKVYALSGRDGAVLWAYETRGTVTSSPALGDPNGDGRLDCVVGPTDGRVHVIAGLDPVRLRASARQRFGVYRRGRWWPTLAELAAERLAEEKDPWHRAVTLVHLGLARLRLADPKAAMDAFAEARKFHLRAPDGAVFEWLASWRWAECPADRRPEVRNVLLDALAFQPDTAFDAFVEVRDLLTPDAIADLRALLDQAPTAPDTQIARALLLAAFARGDARADLFVAAQRRVLAKLQAAEGAAARWHGYLALLAGAQGDHDLFRRAYATYLDLPRRPESLDALLAETAARSQEK